jgi:imidazolonepropionase-like amidohydrolase
MHDIPNATLLPGLIDVHTHVDWHSGLTANIRLGTTPEQRDAAITENLRLTIMAGFTTIQNVGNAADKAWRERRRRTCPGRGFSRRSAASATGTPEAIRARVQQFKNDGADLIKIFGSESSRTGARQRCRRSSSTPRGEANTLGLRTLVHAHAAEAVMRATRAGCTQVEHGAFADRRRSI